MLSLLALAGCTSAKDPAYGGPGGEPLILPPDLNPEKRSMAMAIPTAPATSAGAEKPQNHRGSAILPRSGRALVVSSGNDEAPSSARRVQADTSAAQQPQLQQLEDGTSVLVLHEGFFAAWRRIGLALDRAGFTVVDRNRSAQHYFVRYDSRAERKPKEEGFWDTVVFWRDDIPDTVEKYRIALTEVDDTTQVTVQPSDGTSPTPGTADTILGLIEDHLR